MADSAEPKTAIRRPGDYVVAKSLLDLAIWRVLYKTLASQVLLGNESKFTTQNILFLFGSLLNSISWNPMLLNMQR
jgi:hypothetical protein